MNQSNWLASLAESATPDLDECIEQLGQQISWLNLLKDTPQDPEWHGEGNVHIHTNMVLAELYKLFKDRASHLTGWRRQALILAVILHDIAKPVRTKTAEIKGVERVISPQHEAIGRSYLAFKLMGLDLSFPVIWTVLNLVGEHNKPKLLMIKNQLQHHFWKLARQADMELLYWLEVADMSGRICPDLQQQLLYLDEYRLFSEEYQVWKQPLDIHTILAPHIDGLSAIEQNYVYAQAITGMESGRLSMAEEVIAMTYQHRKNHPHLVVMSGPSGSGKSSWIEVNYPDYILISLDELRTKINGKRNIQKNKGQIIQAAKEQLKVALRSKQGVIWDATNLRSDFRSIICGLGRDYHALVSLIVFLLPEEQLFRQNKQREFDVPESVLHKQLESYQFPMLNEAHQFQVIGNKGKTLFKSGYYDAVKFN